MCFGPGTLRGPEARDCIFLGYNFNGEQIISEGGFILTFYLICIFSKVSSFVNGDREKWFTALCGI